MPRCHKMSMFHSTFEHSMFCFSSQKLMALSEFPNYSTVRYLFYLHNLFSWGFL
uniref:Uncharacterized protein n=1 Tax=Rhizophora mucronata TaxID=61149 RepID=A0A2P2JWF7_RHIMU